MNTSSLIPWMALAMCVHGAAFAASDRAAPPAVPVAPPLEVDLVAPPEPEPPPLPSLADPPEEDAVPRAPVPVARAQANVATRPPATPLAAPAGKVGALLTSGETSDSADPVAFFSDPNGGAYGSGVVAHGGQAEHGTGPTLAAATEVRAPRRESGDGVTPAANLSRAPSLDEPDACRGFFPRDAAFDSATVDLVVIVDASGRVLRTTLARESHAGEGFGAAARACLSSKRFTPGADRAGRAVIAASPVRVHFTR